MKDARPPTKWIKNEFKVKEPWFFDGDELLIAVQVKNTTTGKEYWQMDRVLAKTDGEAFALTMPNGDAYDDWSWWDVDYFIRIDATGPVSDEEMEQLS